jgi:hypothetical protein
MNISKKKNEILNKTAEILFICGYAVSCKLVDSHSIIVHGGKQLHVDPFEDSLEGKHQACVTIEWLRTYKNKLWLESQLKAKRPDQTCWIHVLKRLEWCLRVLSR